MKTITIEVPDPPGPPLRKGGEGLTGTGPLRRCLIEKRAVPRCRQHQHPWPTFGKVRNSNLQLSLCSFQFALDAK